MMIYELVNLNGMIMFYLTSCLGVGVWGMDVFAGSAMLANVKGLIPTCTASDV